MWGTLKPHTCRLPEPAKGDHGHLYCGLCKGLGTEFGQLSRGLVSHDAVFVATLVEALSEEESERGRARCPLLPIVHKPILAPSSTPIRFAAAVQVLLGDQWLADKQVEGSRLAGGLRGLAHDKVEHANQLLAGLGLDFSCLRGFEHEQARAERLGDSSVDEASAPTERALAFVFESIAALPGLAPVAAHEAPRLGRIGAAVGRLIYLTDALEDVERDWQRRRYNPLLAATPLLESTTLSLNQARLSRAATLLGEALTSLEHDVRALPLTRHRELVEDVLCRVLPRRARRALGSARAFASSARAAQLARLETASRLRGAFTRVALLVAFFFTWLFARGAVAQPKATPVPAPKVKIKAPPAVSASASASASASPSASPSALPDASSSATERDQNDDAEALPSADPKAPHGPGIGGCPTCGDCCKGPCSACSGCLNSVTGCCNSCGGCGNSCTSCCDGCTKCDGCCKCNDCGNCGGGNCCCR